VLKAIERLDCSKDFGELNFQPSNYWTKLGKKKPSHNLTRDVFVFLTIGFRDKSAAQFKEAFINEFNRMEQHIHCINRR